MHKQELILDYAEYDKVALNVGFYQQTNAPVGSQERCYQGWFINANDLDWICGSSVANEAGMVLYSTWNTAVLYLYGITTIYTGQLRFNFLYQSAYVALVT